MPRRSRRSLIPKIELKKAEVDVKKGDLALKSKDLEIKAVVEATKASIAREQMASDQTIEAFRTAQRVATNPGSDAITDDNLVMLRDFLHPVDTSAPLPIPPMMPPMAPPQQGMMPPQGMI